MTFDPKRLGLAKTGAFATGVAVVLVAIAYLLARGSGNDLVVVSELGIGPPSELEIFVVIAATIVGGTIGVALAWFAQRFTRRPRLAFVSVCIMGLIGYGILPFLRTDQSLTAIWLNVIHIAAALPIVGLLTYILAHRSFKAV